MSNLQQSTECPICYTSNNLRYNGICTHECCFGCYKKMAGCHVMNCPICRANLRSYLAGYPASDGESDTESDIETDEELAQRAVRRAEIAEAVAEHTIYLNSVTRRGLSHLKIDTHYTTIAYKLRICDDWFPFDILTRDLYMFVNNAKYHVDGCELPAQTDSDEIYDEICMDVPDDE